jgi:hypothetical protein
MRRWAVIVERLQSVLTTDGFSNHNPRGLSFQYDPESGSHCRVIVNHEDPEQGQPLSRNVLVPRSSGAPRYNLMNTSRCRGMPYPEHLSVVATGHYSAKGRVDLGFAISIRPFQITDRLLRITNT